MYELEVVFKDDSMETLKMEEYTIVTDELIRIHDQDDKIRMIINKDELKYIGVVK